MGGGQLQVVALPGVGDRPSRQEGPPEEGGAAAALLQHGEVDVEGQGPGVCAEGLVQRRQLIRVGDLEDLLAASLGQAVKGEPECLFKQQGQPLGKGSVFGHDPGLGGVEGVAVKQHPIGLRLGAALPAQGSPAQLGFYVHRKRHVQSSSM